MPPFVRELIARFLLKLLNLDLLVPILIQSHLLLYSVGLSGYESGRRFGNANSPLLLKMFKPLMSGFDA